MSCSCLVFSWKIPLSLGIVSDMSILLPQSSTSLRERAQRYLERKCVRQERACAGMQVNGAEPTLQLPDCVPDLQTSMPAPVALSQDEDQLQLVTGGVLSLSSLSRNRQSINMQAVTSRGQRSAQRQRKISLHYIARKYSRWN